MAATAVAGEQSPLFGESIDEDGTVVAQFSFKWEPGWGRLTRNHAGSTGFATILQSSNASRTIGQLSRIHLCSHRPCRANWEASKYGYHEVPLHLQPVEAPAVPPAVAESSGQAESSVPSAVAGSFVPSAVAVSPGEAGSPVPSAVAGSFVPPPAVPPPLPPPCEPPNVAAVLESSGGPQTPAAPQGAVLQSLKAPAPASPIDMDVSDDDVVMTSATPAASAVKAQEKIYALLLALARSIRKPKSYVGYSAFILMGLLKKRRPCAWEGPQFIDLIQVFAPWACDRCSQDCAAHAIPCAVISQPDGSCILAPISEQHPLQTCGHFVGGCRVPVTAVADNTHKFKALYASIGIAPVPSVVDGDCGLDVMNMMLEQPGSFDARRRLRLEISDYLLDRIREPWLHDLMVACQELPGELVTKARSAWSAGFEAPAVVAPARVEAPAVAAPAVAEISEEPETSLMLAKPDEETYAAMRWASKLGNDQHVLSLIRSLPSEVIDEQLQLYRHREDTPAVAETNLKPIVISGIHVQLNKRMLVAERFHKYCRSQGIVVTRRLPREAMTSFMKDNIVWKIQAKTSARRTVLKWYRSWRDGHGNVLATEGEHSKPQSRTTVRSLLKSRAPVQDTARCRARGAGRRPNGPLVRQKLYEWWSGLRHAIDWEKLIQERRSRGKKHLARFPRDIIIAKVTQLLEESAYASLLNGERVGTFKPDSWWLARWAEDYGLSMRKANRKFQVPRAVLKERIEIFWTNLFNMRLFIQRSFGYDPMILNFDQSPFHHNETGSQNRLTLGVRNATVPIVEGNTDTKKRWTANLTTYSNFAAVAGGPMPFCEVMFKAESDGRTDHRLQEFHRSRGFPAWFSVTTAPKGSYREHDVITFLDRHLEAWSEGREWRILLADDFSAHKTANVWNLCWSRGYVLLILGGGSTPVMQTCDTDLNEHVRREYGNREARILVEKMRDGVVVPKLSNEECMELMLDVLSDPALHMAASAGYKKTGQTIDLHGKEDCLIVREAATFWNEVTSGGHATMRQHIDAELAAVADEIDSEGLQWCKSHVQRLITPYKPRHEVDKVLRNLGEDFYLDALQTIDDDTAVAEKDHDADSSSSDDSEQDKPAGHVDAAVAGDEPAELPELAVPAELALVESEIIETVGLSSMQADAIERVDATIVGLQATLDGLHAIGALSGVRSIAHELRKEKRRQRQLVAETPAVAEAFLLRRRAEDEEFRKKKHLAAVQHDRSRAVRKSIADRDAAVAETTKLRRSLLEMENIRASKHAIKSFTLESLGKNDEKAGGAKGRNRRFEVLDRLARMGAGLSPGQGNDWPWFKDAWDKAMLAQHGKNWAAVFSGWLQALLDDEGKSNAFSLFVHNETCRVFPGIAALHVPGV